MSTRTLGVLGLVVGLLILLCGVGYGVVEARKSAEVEGVITGQDECTFTYAFEVDGETYDGTLSTEDGDSRKDTDPIVDDDCHAPERNEFAIGDAVDIEYDPGNPAVNGEQDSRWAPYVVGLVGLALTGMAIGVLATGRRRPLDVVPEDTGRDLRPD